MANDGTKKDPPKNENENKDSEQKPKTPPPENIIKAGANILGERRGNPKN